MSTLKLLKNYPTDWEAQLLKSKLASEGIESVIETADTSQMLPYLNFASGYQIFVEPEDYAEAFEIVNNPDDAITDDAEVGTGD